MSIEKIRGDEMRDKIVKPLLAILIVSVSLSFYGCGKRNTASDKDVIAYVNRDPIYKSDLKRDIALRAKFDPAFKLTPETEDDQLDAMINRKVIVQYAMEKGLAREERFVNAIRTIWEHTLIRDFIDYKKKELADYLFATEDDIKKYYENMSQKVTFKVFKTKDKRKIDEAYKKYLKDKDTSGWQTVGPVAYDDITSMALLDAFEMQKDEVKKFEDEPSYYLVEVAEKERVELTPLETLKPDIEKRAIAMKEKRLFEDWLKERKRKANIKINKEFLTQ